MRIILISSVAMALAAGVLSGCSNNGRAESSGRTSVVASFYPMYEAAVRIGGNRVEVANLTPAGAEPHDLELTPKQVDQILDARVVLYMGLGFQPAVEDVVRGRDQGITLDLLKVVKAPLRSSGENGEAPAGRPDPHVWLDPVLMGRLVAKIGDALIRADPEGRAVFERNASTYRPELEALDERFREGLSDCDRHVIVTAHAAFGHLAARYGLTQEPIAGVSPEAEPDPNRLADLAELVKREGVTTIFTEELVSPRVAETLAREAGVTTAVLNPLEGLTAEDRSAGETYVSVMDRNLQILRAALGCR
jgi:zinc transport system substrate-binding protein